MNFSFEQGPIRPPSEATSLLLRLTRNCPWNKCAFCATYKGTTFSRRSVKEIKDDIDTIAEMCRFIKEASVNKGFMGAINMDVMNYIHGLGNYQLLNMAAWLYYGGKTVFFQDANSLLMKTDEIVEILRYLKERLPTVDRVTTYARSTTLMRKSPEELKAMKEAGLTRVHVGLESGSDEVLRFIKKGITAEQHIEAGKKVVEAGLSLSEYVILGMGGKKLWEVHALETAKVLSSINPDYIRFRSLTVSRGTTLSEMVERGEFFPETEEEIVIGERLLIENLEGIQSTVVSDHSLNLLEEVNGKLPEEKEKMLAVIDRFLTLPPEERNNFVLGKRWGQYRIQSDMQDAARHAKVAEALKTIEQEGSFEETIAYLRNQNV